MMRRVLARFDRVMEAMFPMTAHDPRLQLRHTLATLAYQPVGELPVSPGGVFQAGTSSEALDNSLGSWLRTSSSSRLEIRSPDSR